MTLNQSIPFLRYTFLADALASGATGFLAYVAAKLLADVLGLPELLLGMQYGDSIRRLSIGQLTPDHQIPFGSRADLLPLSRRA